MSTPLGLELDGKVHADSLTEPAPTELGFLAHPWHVRSKVVYASFRDAESETLSDYNKILHESNTSALHLPAHGENYPNSSVEVALRLEKHD